MMGHAARRLQKCYDCRVIVIVIVITITATATHIILTKTVGKQHYNVGAFAPQSRPLKTENSYKISGIKLMLAIMGCKVTNMIIAIVEIGIIITPIAIISIHMIMMIMIITHAPEGTEGKENALLNLVVTLTRETVAAFDDDDAGTLLLLLLLLL